MVSKREKQQVSAYAPTLPEFYEIPRNSVALCFLTHLKQVQPSQSSYLLHRPTLTAPHLLFLHHRQTLTQRRIVLS